MRRASLFHVLYVHKNRVAYKGQGKNGLAIVQELCESRGGRPGLSLLTSLLASVDVKIY